jgi:hypothetical protein
MIVEKVKKSSHQSHKAIVNIVSPCIKVKSNGKVLVKAKVVVAD